MIGLRGQTSRLKMKILKTGFKLSDFKNKSRNCIEGKFTE
jgi:hypothetical protein